MKKRVSRPKKHEHPLLFRSAVVALTALLIVLLGASIGNIQRFALKYDGVAAVVNTILLDLLNTDRQKNDLRTLAVSPLLTEAAQAKANDMAEKGYFAHITPEGYDSWHWFKEAGYVFEYAGENLAVNFSESADVQKAWMNSPSHRANILNDHFTEVGIAIAVGTYKGKQTVFAVQMFGKPISRIASETISLPPVTAVTSPAKADDIAIATTIQTASSSQKVLGETSERVVESLPLWAHGLTSPLLLLKILYYLFGAVLFGTLLYTVRSQVSHHHMRYALIVFILIVLMIIAFIGVDLFLFPVPTLAL